MKEKSELKIILTSILIAISIKYRHLQFKDYKIPNGLIYLV
jgi:hypothetical protein